MPKYRVSDIAKMYREENPNLPYSTDSDIMTTIAKDTPQLLGEIDREDLARTMKQGQAEQISRQARKEFGALSGYDRFGAGAGQSMMDIYQGIKQMMGGNTDAYKEDKSAYMDASKGNKMAAAGEIFGALAATAPIPGVSMAKLGTKAALVAGAAVGAGYGLSEYVDEGESRLGNMAVGATLGVGTTALGMLAKKIGTKAFNAWKGKYGNASHAELEDLAKKEGIKLSQGDVTGKSGTRKAEVGAESKVGGLSDFREGQAKDANRIMENLVTGMEPKEGKNIGKQLLESTERARDKAKEQARKNYNKVEELSGGAKIVPSNSISRLGKVEKEFKGDVPADNATAEWFRQLNENLASGKKSYGSLRQTRESLGKEAKKHAVSDPNRQRLILEVRNEVEKDMDDAIGAQVESMTKRTGNKFQKLAGADMVNPYKKSEMAKEALKQTEKGKQLKEAYEIAKKQYREDVVPYKTSTSLKSILKGEEPDQIYKKMIQEGHNDKAKIFYKALDNDGRETVAYGIVKTALDKAKTKTPSGTNYSPAVFSTYLDDMGKHSKLFMSGEQKAKTDGVEKLMKAAVRAGQYAENPPTGNRAEIAKELRNAKVSLGLIPLLTQFEKFFWTGAGKKYLLAASKIEPGTSKMNDLIEKLLSEAPKLSEITSKKLTED